MAYADRKQKSVAYLLWCLGFVGLCGVHRLYTERYVIGLLYLFTFGFCFLGQLIDLLLIPDDVETVNHGLLQRPLPRQGAPAHSLAPELPRSLPAAQPISVATPSAAVAGRSGEAPLPRRTEALLADAQAAMERLRD
jgi:hypothetical protein